MFREFDTQPGSGRTPFTVNRGRRKAGYLGGLSNRQAGKEAQFNDLALPRIHGGQRLQRVVERQQVSALPLAQMLGLRQRDLRLIAASLEP